MNNNTVKSEKKSGIYKITNIKNGKVYIGQSNDILRRKNEHLRSLSNGYHYNDYLQNSFNKYGLENFLFEIIEYCKEDELDKKEMYYIKHYNSMDKTKGYNLRAGGNKPILSMESRIKISHTRKERIKQGLIKPNNIVFTKETREKMSSSIKEYFSKEENRIKASRCHSTIDFDVVYNIKRMLYNDVDISEVSTITGVGRDKIAHISQLDSFTFILPEYNFYIKNRHTIQQLRQARKIMNLYREGYSYREISEVVSIHERNVIRQVNRNKSIHDDRCRLNCINKSILKRDSLIRTLYSMGKNTVEISNILKVSRNTIAKALRNETILYTSVDQTRGKVKPFKYK